MQLPLSRSFRHGGNIHRMRESGKLTVRKIANSLTTTHVIHYFLQFGPAAEFFRFPRMSQKMPDAALDHSPVKQLLPELNPVFRARYKSGGPSQRNHFTPPDQILDVTHPRMWIGLHRHGHVKERKVKAQRKHSQTPRPAISSFFHSRHALGIAASLGVSK